MKRTRTLGAAPADQSGHVLGVPTGLLVFGVLAAAGYAYYSAGADTGPATQTGGAVPSPSPTGNSSGSTLPAPTKPASSSSSSTAVKQKRPAVVKAASPLLYVFVDSIGGEGVFARLRTTYSPFDGYGWQRIVTLANKEFAGWATGNTWTAPNGGLYLQLYVEVSGIGYNYWIDKTQTKQVHAQQAQISYGWADNLRMTATTQSSIAAFFFNNYIL